MILDDVLVKSDAARQGNILDFIGNSNYYDRICNRRIRWPSTHRDN